MHTRRKFSIFIGILLTALLLPTMVLAGNATVGPVSISTPDTYNSCEARSDNIYLTGVPEGWYLSGWVNVDFVTAGGRIPVPGGYQSVYFAGPGDLTLTVNYPPIDEWPPYDAGSTLREIHVDISINVFDDNNVKIGTLGPGVDWDVWCNVPPPPPPPPPGGQGCTPGYWRQDQHFDSWIGYAPGDSYNTVFGVAGSFDTLLDAVWAKGGDEAALARHAVAALLNASNPDVAYAYSESEVIALVQSAYASGDFEGVKNQFESANESFCSLD